MDHRVGARASLKQELREQALHERIRAEIGEDVLTPEQLPS